MFHPKQLFKLPVQKFLESLVRLKLARTNPKIIGVTGSFGKTTTKEAIYEVLKSRFNIYRNPKSLNTEFGLLLAILEQPSGFSSPLKWTAVLLRAALNALFGKKYDFLILEYGADKPGDIGHLVSLVKPHIGIITHIARTHQAEGQFKNAEEVFEEKKKLVACLEKSDVAILNFTDSWLSRLKGKLKAKTYGFGREPGNYISADNLKNTADGFEAAIHLGKQKVYAKFPVAGAFHIDAFLPALLCGTLYGITLEEGIKSLQHFRLPPGRLSIVEGKNGSTLLDSSYNASPETMKQAILLLKEFPGKRKIAVLGNMNELGDYTEKAHEEIAEQLGGRLDMLITVGEWAAFTAKEALKNGLQEHRIKVLLTAQEAAEFLLDKVRKGDIVLFKGSQNRVRLERAVKILMAKPEEAKRLLCRQEKEWEEIE